jgi:hypothetical protein
MYIEMCCPNRGMDILEGYYQWKKLAEGNSACEFFLPYGGTEMGRRVTDKQLKTIIDDGITSFKIFLAYKDFLGVYDDELFKILSFAAENNIIVTAHTENADLIAEMQMRLLGEGKTASKYHEKSRPDFVEASGVDHFAAFLETTGARGYVVHLSNILALNQAIEARKRGVRLGVEVVIPHLILDYSYAEREDFEGAKYVMSPPLRQKKRPGSPLGRIEIPVWLIPWPRTTAPLTSASKRSWGKKTSPRSPTVSPPLKTGSTSSTPTGFPGGLKPGKIRPGGLHQFSQALWPLSPQREPEYRSGCRPCDLRS